MNAGYLTPEDDEIIFGRTNRGLGERRALAMIRAERRDSHVWRFLAGSVVSNVAQEIAEEEFEAGRSNSRVRLCDCNQGRLPCTCKVTA
jgi:hypothetical protein